MGSKPPTEVYKTAAATFEHNLMHEDYTRDKARKPLNLYASECILLKISLEIFSKFSKSVAKLGVSRVSSLYIV